ncbi:hypothetical protein Tco_1348397 [Tanacetum coccineum]
MKTIRSFKQETNEPLHCSWERFTESLFSCPEHKLNEHEQLQIFYQGLDTKTRQKVDFKGLIPRRTPTREIEAIKELSKHSLSCYKEGNTKAEDEELQVVLNQISRSLNSLSLSSLSLGLYLCCRRVPLCSVIFDLEPLSLSFDFVFIFEIFKSLSLRLCRHCHLAIWCLDQHAHTLHHLESLLTISLDNNYLDNLDIFKEDLEYQSCGSLYL